MSRTHHLGTVEQEAHATVSGRRVTLRGDWSAHDRVLISDIKDIPPGFTPKRDEPGVFYARIVDVPREDNKWLIQVSSTSGGRGQWAKPDGVLSAWRQRLCLVKHRPVEGMWIHWYEAVGRTSADERTEGQVITSVTLAARIDGDNKPHVWASGVPIAVNANNLVQVKQC